MDKFFHKIFVSSTFKDFHAERDELLYKIFPDFRAEARKHGDEVDMVELRWGVDNFGLTKEQLVSRVLSVCLNEIDDSRPFMLIFLGDRFGWVPERDWIAEDFSSKFKRGSVVGQSVTALEIKYALEKTAEPRCIICIRDLGDAKIPDKVRDTYFDTDAEKCKALDSLKTWLREKYRDRIIDYTADFNPAKGRLENFRVKGEKNISLNDAIRLKLSAEFKTEWAKFDAMSWQRRELDAANNFVKNRAKLFVGRKKIVGELKYELLDSQCVFLRGEPGSGKTSIACKVADYFRKAGQKICFIACGSSTQNSTAQIVLQQMIFFLERDVLQIESPPEMPADYERCKNRLDELCNEIPDATPIYFFLDAVEQLSERHDLNFIPTAKNVHCLVTCADDFEIPSSFYNPAAHLDGLLNSLDDAELEDFFRDNFRIQMDEQLREEFRSASKKVLPMYPDKYGADVVKQVFDSLINGKDWKQNFFAGLREFPDLFASFAPKKFLVKDLAPLERSEIIPVLRAMLQRKGKTLFDATAAAVLNHKNANNPLWLELTDQLLNMIASPQLLAPQIRDNPELIAKLTADVVTKMPDEPARAAKYILKEATEKLCLEPETLTEAMNFLAASRHGLRHDDIEKLLGKKILDLDWSLIQNFLPNYFVERNGQTDLAHRLIRQGLREDFSADEFTRREEKICEYLEKLSPEDSLRKAEGICYAQRFKRYRFAAELYSQAHRIKTPVLLSEIHAALCDDDGKFFVDLIRNHENDIDDVSDFGRFFFDEFQAMIIGGSTKELAIGCAACEAFAEKFPEDSLPRYMAKMFQARYEDQRDNFEQADRLCEEIIRWGEEHAEHFGDNLNFCMLISGIYNLSASLAKKRGDSDKENFSSAQCVRWAKAAQALDDTPQANTYRNLTALKELAQMSDVDAAQKLETARRLYSDCKAALQQSDGKLELLLTAMACVHFLRVRSELEDENLTESLTVAAEGKNYAQKLLAADANNSEYVKATASVLAEMCLTELRAIKAQHTAENSSTEELLQAAQEHSFEALRLLNQNYMRNRTKENLVLLQETAAVISNFAHELNCGFMPIGWVFLDEKIFDA